MPYHLQVGRLTTGILLALALLGQVGCSSPKDPFRTNGQYKEDQRLTKRITDALHDAPVYQYPDVTINVFQGRVQLSGFVATEGQREVASEITKQIPGVVAVRNDLILKHPLMPAIGGTGDWPP
ncbi:MAG TPA: BON domain-containing protein [Candidatus Sulfotelmatobacter sp.]|nr:BON domain-containing protein [Candidatus Sulfotelmatobacter sp.]HWI60134.1 BON domain-containing protein [Bacillota bacterium]